MPEQLQDQARGLADEAQSQGQEVAQKAAAEASNLADRAKTHAGDVTAEIKTEGLALAGDARRQLRRQVEAQTEHLAEGVDRLGTQARALAEGRPEEAGPFKDYAYQVADGLGGVAQRVQTAGLDGVVNDVQRFARRRPGVFLLGAAVAGFAAGRLLRGSAGSSDGAPTMSTPRYQPQGIQAATGNGGR